MAETKTRSKPKSKARVASKPKRSRSSSKGKATKPKRSAQTTANGSKASNSTSKPKAAVEAVEGTAKEAGHAVAQAASKAKVPLMAGGAALAGVAGGIALGNRQAHRHRGLKGIDSDDLAKAARKVGNIGVQVGEVAYQARRAREASNGSTHRSPVEVVLDGLTSRRPRD